MNKDLSGIPDELIDRINSKCVWEGECFVWTAKAVFPTGYGHIRYKYEHYATHRVILSKKLGRPLVLWALHTCDNPPCNNPDHLYEGTRQQNIDDMIRRGRKRTGKLSGTEHGRSKLTIDDVKAIKRRLADGETQKKIAFDFDVGQTCISNINQNKTYQGEKYE